MYWMLNSSNEGLNAVVSSSKVAFICKKSAPWKTPDWPFATRALDNTGVGPKNHTWGVLAGLLRPSAVTNTPAENAADMLNTDRSVVTFKVK